MIRTQTKLLCLALWLMLVVASTLLIGIEWGFVAASLLLTWPTVPISEVQRDRQRKGHHHWLHWRPAAATKVRQLEREAVVTFVLGALFYMLGIHVWQLSWTELLMWTAALALLLAFSYVTASRRDYT